MSPQKPVPESEREAAPDRSSERLLPAAATPEPEAAPEELKAEAESPASTDPSAVELSAEAFAEAKLEQREKGDMAVVGMKLIAPTVDDVATLLDAIPVIRKGGFPLPETPSEIIQMGAMLAEEVPV